MDLGIDWRQRSALWHQYPEVRMCLTFSCKKTLEDDEKLLGIFCWIHFVLCFAQKKTSDFCHPTKYEYFYSSQRFLANGIFLGTMFWPSWIYLGGGFKYCLFSPLPGEMIQFDEHIFQLAWNHQPDLHPLLGMILWVSFRRPNGIIAELLRRRLLPGPKLSNEKTTGCPWLFRVIVWGLQ